MTAYEAIKNEEVKARVHGEYITVKPYSLVESWINVNKWEQYYFSIEVDGKRYFISIDRKTANDRAWHETSIFGNKAMKVNANGYVYINNKGYAQFVIKDLNNFERVYN